MIKGQAVETVVINGRFIQVPRGEISYEDLARLADRGEEPTIMYAYKIKGQRTHGTLNPGKRMPVVSGTIFNVMDTSRA